MTRRTFLLVLLLLTTGWLAYVTWPAQWQKRATERAALERCRDISESDNIDMTALRARRARCEAMEVAFQEKWR